MCIHTYLFQSRTMLSVDQNQRCPNRDNPQTLNQVMYFDKYFSLHDQYDIAILCLASYVGSLINQYDVGSFAQQHITFQHS